MINNTFDFSSGVATGASGKVLSGGQIVDAVNSGIPSVSILCLSDTQTIEFIRGEISYRIVPSQDLTLSITGGEIGQYQVIHIIIQQPPISGFQVSLPDNIIWTGEKPFIDSRGGSFTLFDIVTFDGGNSIYGRTF